MKANILVIVIVYLVCACASQKNAVFVTSTSLSILEADTKPTGLSVGFKRVEGYIGPNNADGSAPPVLASIESDQKVFNPRIRQLYATGDAAIIASGGVVSNKTGTKKTTQVMFFGTSTNIGLTIGTTSSVPDSFNFGYKRKEMSVIPLIEFDHGYSYPSVLASIDSTGLGNDGKLNESGLLTSQFFAAGKAADKLAETLGPTFVDRARAAVNANQREETQNVSLCYSNLALDKLPGVWADASRLDLFSESDDERGNILKDLMNKYGKAVKDGTVIDYNLLVKANASYINNAYAGNNNDQERLKRLTEHRGLVCGLSRIN